MVANDPAHPERSSRGVDGKTTYSEGIFIGYRWFDQQKLTPLYPFGYGLSYSTFVYSKPKVVRASDGGLDVSFSCGMRGKRLGMKWRRCIWVRLMRRPQARSSRSGLWPRSSECGWTQGSLGMLSCTCRFGDCSTGRLRMRSG
jgi:hypothetical protein